MELIEGTPGSAGFPGLSPNMPTALYGRPQVGGGEGGIRTRRPLCGRIAIMWVRNPPAICEFEGMAVLVVSSEPVSAPNSLLTGKIQGNFGFFGPKHRLALLIAQRLQ